MNGFAWLNELMQWLARWVPRITLIEATHAGVLFGPGGSVSRLYPGLTWYWPISHALLLVPMTTQSVQMSGQVLELEDAGAIVPRVLICSVAVQYRIADPLLAATKALKVHALVDNRAQAAIATTREPDRQRWLNAASAQLSTALYPFGVVVERMDFTQVGIGVAVKQVEAGAWQDEQHGMRVTE